MSLLSLLTWAANTAALQSGDYQYAINPSDTNAVTITDYTGAGGDLEIPEMIDSLQVTRIGDRAFYAQDSLTSIFIPNSVTSLEYGAFHLCTNLTAITVGPNNPAYSSIDGVLFNKGQTTLLQYPNGHSESYAVPDGVTTIAEMAFEYCTDLNSITFPNSLVTIENRALGHCTSLSYLIFPDNITYIAGASFVNCSSLTSVSIPASVERLGDWPTGFSFGIGAFRACTNLTSITVPASVVDIGMGVFSGSDNLTSLYFLGNAPKIDSYLFYDDYNATVYYMPNTTGWGVTFGNLPTVLWNPQAQDINADSNAFGFTITGPESVEIIVDACEDLMNPAWFPVSTNTLVDGAAQFIDYPPMNPSSRFYRFRAP